MNIYDRQKYITERIAIAEIAGTSKAEIAMLESALYEMHAVIQCLTTELAKTDPVFINSQADVPSGYISIKNTSGMDFSRLSFEIDVEKDEKVIKTITVETVDWKNGNTARFYFNEDLSSGEELAAGAEAVSYERAYPHLS